MNKIKKMLLVTIGLIAFVLGAIGVILPILPTTPFLLLASFCFVKGSDKFDKWFKNTGTYKKHLESFVNNRAMTLKQKISILLFADFMLAFPFFILDSIHMKIFIIILVICKFYYFFFKIDTIKEPGSRIKKEKYIVEIMIKLYCNKKHKCEDSTCEECSKLLEYTQKRLSYCKFGDDKTSCSKCSIHCYKKDMKVKIKDVMKFSGPRLLIYKPHEYIRHIFK